MALIFEDENKTLGKKQLKVPDEVVKKLKVTRNLFDKYSKSKGFKRINAILDDDYNKRSKKKDKIHNGDKTISGSDAKKIAFEKEHGEISNNPNDLNNIFTKPLFPWLNDAIRSARTSVKKVKAVPPVPKLEKKPADIEDVNKPIKMGNASIRIENASPSKKVIMSEGQLLVLKEYHDQQVFNFDNKGNAYFEKNNWEHYVDFLENIGTYGQLPASQWTRQNIINEVEKAKEKIEYSSNDLDEEDYRRAFLEVVHSSFIYENTQNEDFVEDFLKNFNDYNEFKKTHNYYDEADTLDEFIRNKNLLDDVDDIEGFLTPSGYEKYLVELHNMFTDKIEDHDMVYGLKFNKRGLIYIERDLSIPKFDLPKFENEESYYDYLNRNYYSLGKYFTWEEDAGDTYWGEGYVVGSSRIKLKCWIDPKDVDWEETTRLNCYFLREEKEIAIKESGINIEVFDVILEKGDVNGVNVSGKSLLKRPIVIPY